MIVTKLNPYGVLVIAFNTETLGYAMGLLQKIRLTQSIAFKKLFCTNRYQHQLANKDEINGNASNNTVLGMHVLTLLYRYGRILTQYKLCLHLKLNCLQFCL